VSNYAYEKLVERFVNVYHERRQMVKKSHVATRGALENIDRENAVAESLQKDLDREKKVGEDFIDSELMLTWITFHRFSFFSCVCLLVKQVLLFVLLLWVFVFSDPVVVRS